MCRRYDGQVKELSSLYVFSSRLITNGVETIEIPFESSRRDGMLSYIMDRIKDEHGVVISRPGTGSIVIRLKCDTFPASRPEFCMTLLDSLGGFHVLRDEDLQRYGILGETYDHVWGDPTVRLATIVSNLWYTLGCVESPRKQALREMCCLVDDAVHQEQDGGRKKNRLNVVFETCRSMYSTLSMNSKRSDYSDDVSLRQELDDFPLPEKPPGKIEYADVEQFVNSLSEDDVLDAMLDSQRLEQMVSSPALCALVDSRLSASKAHHVDLAEANVKKAEELHGLQKQIAVLKSEYDAKLVEFREKNARQEKARELFGPDILIKQLASSAHEYENKSIKILDMWKKRGMSNDAFVKEFVDTKAKAYACRQKHAWAVTSIPIPRRSSWGDTTHS